MELVEKELEDIANQFKNGDANVRSRLVGRAVGEIFIFFIGSKGLTKTLEILGNYAKYNKIGELVINKAGGAAEIIEGAAEAIAKAHSYITNAIEDALTEFRRIIRGGDYYEVEFADPFGNIIKERVPFNEINQNYFSKIDEAAGFANIIEQVLDKMQTYGQARNKALEIVGDLGYDSKPYVGRLGTGEGKIVGRQSVDGKVRWRLDYDPEKGPHINVEDFRNGKGSSATKIAIPFEGDINTIEAPLKVLNQ